MKNPICLFALLALGCFSYAPATMAANTPNNDDVVCEGGMFPTPQYIPMLSMDTALDAGYDVTYRYADAAHGLEIFESAHTPPAQRWSSQVHLTIRYLFGPKRTPITGSGDNKASLNVGNELSISCWNPNFTLL
jgi:hypothetical protein